MNGEWEVSAPRTTVRSAISPDNEGSAMGTHEHSAP